MKSQAGLLKTYLYINNNNKLQFQNNTFFLAFQVFSHPVDIKNK